MIFIKKMTLWYSRSGTGWNFLNIGTALLRLRGSVAAMTKILRRPSLKPLGISCTQGHGSDLPPEAPSAAPIGPNRGAST